MFDFCAAEPYPLLELDQVNSLDARKHSESVDRWLGFEIPAVESAIRRESTLAERETWVNIDAQVFLTPFVELRFILNQIDLQASHTLVDFGAAYCRLAFVMDRHYPTLKFYGIEFVEQRVKESQRLFEIHRLAQASIKWEDLSSSDFVIPKAECYFIYDFGKRQEIESLMENLRKFRATPCHFTLVARGQRTRDIIESEHRSWLFKQGPLSKHCEFAIYTTN